mgnify:CR=1 FL=1
MAPAQGEEELFVLSEGGILIRTKVAQVSSYGRSSQGVTIMKLGEDDHVVASIVMLDRTFKIDDPVGAISVHGVVGIWGLLAVPLSNADATFVAQLMGIGTIFLWVFAASFIVWFILKLTMGIRVSEQEEHEGVDIGECGLEAYPEFTATAE